eukprot:gene12509-6257_t
MSKLKKQKEKEVINLIEKANYEFFKHSYDKAHEMYNDILKNNEKYISDELYSKVEFKISSIFENIQFWDEEINHLDLAISKTTKMKEKYLTKKSSALMRLQDFNQALDILNSLSETTETKRLKMICKNKLNYEKENPFSFIPEDIWMNIFLFLELNEINEISLVSWEWNILTDSNAIWKFQCLKKFKNEENEKIQNWKLFFIELMKPKIEIKFAGTVSNIQSFLIGPFTKKEELISNLRETFDDVLLDNPTHIIVKRSNDGLKQPFKSIEPIENVLSNTASFSNTIQHLGINNEDFRFCELCGVCYSIKSLLPKTCVSHSSSKSWYKFTHPDQSAKSKEKKVTNKQKEKKVKSNKKK